MLAKAIDEGMEARATTRPARHSFAMIPAGGKRPYWMCRVDRWVGGQGAGAGAGSGRRGGERARAQVCAGILGVACMARALATCEPRGDLLTWKLLKDITGSSAEAAASDAVPCCALRTQVLSELGKAPVLYAAAAHQRGAQIRVVGERTL